jgi:hypothetical protein
MITHLLTRPCTLRKQVEGPKDEFGDVTYTATEKSTTCELQQAQTTEFRDGRQLQVSTWNLYLPSGEDPAGWDEVELDGQVWTFEGDPWTVRHPRTGALSHVESRVRRVR